MDIIRNNPYRVLGVYANASKREIVANQSKMKAYAKTGQKVSFPSDWEPWLGPIDRTADSIQQAANDIALPNDALRYGLFWFMDNDDISHKQLNAINHAISTSGSVNFNTIDSPSTGVTCNNLAITALLQQNWAIALLMYHEIITNNVFKVSGIDKIQSLSEEEYCQLVGVQLFKSFPDVDWINILQTPAIVVFGISVNLKEKLNNSSIAKVIVKESKDKVYASLEKLLIDAQNEKTRTPIQNLTIANRLENEGKILLRSLRIVEGSKTTTYLAYADKLANKIVDLCIQYYIKSKEVPDHAKKILKLIRFAYRISEGKLAKDRCKKNLDIVVAEVDQLAPSSVVVHQKKINDILNAIEAQKQKQLSDLKNATIGCKAELDNIRTTLSSENEYYIKESTSVTQYVIGIVVDIVNAKQKAYNDAPQNNDIAEYRAYMDAVATAIEIMELLASFTMDEKCQKRFDKNYKTLKGIRSRYVQNTLNYLSSSPNLKVSQPVPPQFTYTPTQPKKDEDYTGCIVWIIIISVIGLLAIFGKSSDSSSNTSSGNSTEIDYPATDTDVAYPAVEPYSDDTQNSDTQYDALLEQYRNNSLPTGTTPYKKIYGGNTRKGSAKLKIKAPLDCDVLVMIKNTNDQVVKHAYIKAGDTYAFQMPPGTYQPFFVFGKSWCPETLAPNGLNGYFLEDISACKDEPQRIGSYQILSYSLQRSESGNFSAESSSPSEAF